MQLATRTGQGRVSVVKIRFGIFCARRRPSGTSQLGPGGPGTQLTHHGTSSFRTTTRMLADRMAATYGARKSLKSRELASAASPRRLRLRSSPFAVRRSPLAVGAVRPNQTPSGACRSMPTARCPLHCPLPTARRAGAAGMAWHGMPILGLELSFPWLPWLPWSARHLVPMRPISHTEPLGQPARG